MRISAYNKTGLALLSCGTLGAGLSVIYESTVLAIIGLTLAFWGILFLLVFPGTYAQSEVLDCMSSSSLSAVDQIIAESNVRGKAVYIPVLREAYLPYHIRVRNEFLYIPKRNVKTETAIEQALMRNPKGLRLTPPGLGLANLAQKKSRLDFYNLDLDSLMETLSPIITHDLEMADKFELSLGKSVVNTEISRPICEGICKEVSKMQYVCPHIGCPLSSSIACILTRVTNKPIIIERCLLREHKIEISYRIL